MHRVDRLLGPLNPNKLAAGTTKPPKQILVFNATEEESASVCEVLIKDNKWKVYGLVDDLTHPVAQKLKALQVQTIVGDLTDPESYKHHLNDLDGVFIHTAFDGFIGDDGDHEKAVEREIRHTKALVDACVQAKVKHLVYSTLDDLPDDIHVPHCWAKATVAKYIKSTGLPATYLYTCTPFSIITNKDLLYPGPDGNLVLQVDMPDDCQFPGYPTEQTGDWVKMAFSKSNKWIGKDMHAATEFVSPSSMAKDLSKVGKRTVTTTHLSFEQFFAPEHKKKLGEVTWSHYAAFLEGKIKRDVEASETIVPHQWRFRQWAAYSPEIQQILKA